MATHSKVFCKSNYWVRKEMILQLDEKLIVPSNPVFYGFEKRIRQGILILSSGKMRTNRLYIPKGGLGVLQKKRDKRSFRDVGTVFI